MQWNNLSKNILNISGAARAYGCLSTSFSRLERDTRRREAFSLNRDLDGFVLTPLYNFIDFFVIF
jgi:hypothetical protein